MSTNIKDCGPAFPELRHVLHPYANEGRGELRIEAKPGMTLRDYFAGQALAGMLASPDCGGSVSSIVRHAYSYSDAMIAQREAHK